MKALVILAFIADPAFGQLGPLIYSQAPNRNFGFASDSLFRDDFGQIQGSLYADRFQVSAAAVLGQLVWYGLYGAQDQGFDPEPPISESFRIRLFSQVNSPIPPLQLPADVLYETSTDAVFREFNGAFVNGRREYRYILNLPMSFTIQPGTPYWLEISQIGDVNSFFRWESSTGGERAFEFPLGSTWQMATGGQLAYELRVPEPMTGSFVAVVVLARATRRSNSSR